MDESSALAFLNNRLAGAGDDAAIVDDLVITIDMLHDETDFPPGTDRYTAGWRAVGASLSDVAAMGAEPVAAVAAYAAPSFDQSELADCIDGATDVCESVGTKYVGGDLDIHQEFTLTSAAIGRTPTPVTRHGATPGEAVYVTGALGRSAAAMQLFEANEIDQANRLMRFPPRIAEGQLVADVATAMMDSSDGLARSLHQLATASSCGFSISSDALPISATLERMVDDSEEVLQQSLHFGEDFELVFTGEPAAIDARQDDCETPLTRIGSVVESKVQIDDSPLPNVGYEHTGRKR